MPTQSKKKIAAMSIIELANDLTDNNPKLSRELIYLCETHASELISLGLIENREKQQRKKQAKKYGK